MCCGDREISGAAHDGGAGKSCGCHDPGHHGAVHRAYGRFGEGGISCCGGERPRSREEMISILEGYRGSLKRELERVEEKLEELKGDL
jgi:hypothetical protein